MGGDENGEERRESERGRKNKREKRGREGEHLFMLKKEEVFFFSEAKIEMGLMIA